MEAWPVDQHTVLRDIPVYNGWIDETSSELCHNVDEFVDSLKPNTTYTLDFADAISDNNEGNPLGFYRYVFSTGNEIDSLELSGQVVNAESGEPVLNVYVELYPNLADSMPLLEVPDYVARTDSSGFSV